MSTDHSQQDADQAQDTCDDRSTEDSGSRPSTSRVTNIVYGKNAGVMADTVHTVIFRTW